VQASHLIADRDGLNDARLLMGLPPFGDTTVSVPAPGASIDARHVDQLRHSMRRDAAHGCACTAAGTGAALRQLQRDHSTKRTFAASTLYVLHNRMCQSRRPCGKLHAALCSSFIGLFLILLGVERFFVAIVRAKDDRFFGSFTVAQLISVLLMVAGVVLALYKNPSARSAGGSPVTPRRA
jgi:hypothetical protein